MSIRVMSAVWERTDLDPYERLVMLSLADHADDSGACYPSVARLTQRTGMTDRGVQKVVSRLTERGIITVDLAAGPSGKNLYRIIPAPEPSSPPNPVHPERGSPNPRTRFTTPPNPVRKTPEPGSPEPSGTIIEPSGNRQMARARASPAKVRLPDDWHPGNEGVAYAIAKGIPQEIIHDEIAGFGAYWRDRTDRESRKSDEGWRQCWQGWCRRIAPRYAHHRPATGRAYGRRDQQPSGLVGAGMRSLAQGTR